MDILSFVLGYNKGKAQGGSADAVLDEVDAYLDAINGETDVSVSGGTSNDDRVKYVTFMHGETELIKYPVIIGDTVKDVVRQKIIDEPTKEPTETIEYSYGGWSLTDGGEADSNALKNVVEDRTVYYVFKESARKYTVKFYDGETLLKTEQVVYGGEVTYEATKDGYFLGGWSLTNGGEVDTNALTNVTEDRTVYAVWVESIAFADATWAEIDMVSKKGNASKMWSVGDKKKITIGGLTREIVIIGFDMDKDSDGNTVGVTMTIADEPYPETTFEVPEFSSKAWADWGIQAAVDGIFADLPEDMQAVIKPVLKTYNGFRWTYNENDVALEASKYLWMFDSQELGDTKHSSCPYTLPAYPYFNSNTARKFGSYSDTTTGSYDYYTRTIFLLSSLSNRTVKYVNNNGYFNSNNGYNEYSIRFGFCV